MKTNKQEMNHNKIEIYDEMETEAPQFENEAPEVNGVTTKGFVLIHEMDKSEPTDSFGSTQVKANPVTIGIHELIQFAKYAPKKEISIIVEIEGVILPTQVLLSEILDDKDRIVNPEILKVTNYKF